MRKRCLAWGLIALALCGLLSSPAAVYHVATNGSDSTGNGSEAQPWRTIRKACARILQPGDQVLIAPGHYPNDEIEFTNSGSAAVGLTTGVRIEGPNRLRFPASADFSAIDPAHTNQYYLNVYRSWRSNNGSFLVTNALSAGTNRVIEVSGAEDWVPENGVPGDPAWLSACVARPIVFRNRSTNRATERVIVDASGSSIYTLWFVGEYLTDSDANSTDFNRYDGIDLTGMQGGGVHLQDSSFNVFTDVRVYNGGASGFLMAGNTNDAAAYNMLIDCKVWNTPYEGIYLGAGGHPQDECHLYYAHVIDCEVMTTGSTAQARLENAIDLKEYGIGLTVEGCYLHDIQVETYYNGALFLQHHTRDTLIYNNRFENIGYRSQRPVAAIQMDLDGVRNAAVFNNLITRTNALADRTYAFAIVGYNNTTNVVVAHNTVIGMHRALFLGYYQSGAYDLTLANNLFACGDTAGNIVEIDGDDGLRTVTHNLWNPAPTEWASEPGRLSGDPGLVDTSGGNFRPASGSPAIDSATNLYAWLFTDADGKTRPIDGDHNGSPIPDRGAFEYGTAEPDTEPPSTPTGLALTDATAFSIALRWTASTDDVAVALYRVERDGGAIGTIASTNYTDGGLTPETPYSYRVRAEDAAGNTSAWSLALQASTLSQDLSAPSTPTGLRLLNRTESAQVIAWNAATDNVAVTTYRIECQGAWIGSTPALAFTNTGLASASNYTYRVRAADAATNLSAYGESLTAPTLSGRDAYTLLFDFGNPSYSAAGHWNPVASAAPNNFTGVMVTNAIDTNGLARGVELSITDDFYDDTTGGVNSDGRYPANVTRDGWWLGNYAGYGEADTTGGVRLAGFPSGVEIALTLFGSRADTSYDRQGRYTCGVTSATLNAVNNVADVAVLGGLQPDTGGAVELRVTPVLASGFAYLGALEVTVSAPPTNEVSLQGTPYAWLLTNYPGQAATLEALDTTDTDGDGHAAWQEYLAGTEPTNAGSVLRVTREDPGGPGIAIQWPAVAGRRYAVGYDTNLADGFADAWLVTNLNLGAWTDGVHAGESAGFYRLRVQRE